MRICIVADFSQNQDEGFKNIAFNLARELSEYHQVLRLDTGRYLSPAQWRVLKRFKPQIIHYIPGRTIKSFIILKVLALYSGKVKTVMSAFHPDIASVPQIVVTMLRPDLVLTQSDGLEKKFKSLNCTVSLLPNGVDAGKFKPVSSKAKERLREKYGVDKQKLVILHVGHLIKARNLQLLSEIQDGSNQVIVVVSLSGKMDGRLYRRLKEAGCMVWVEYFPKIEEIYAMADCYVFPVARGYSILMPLSVMEAMACNLPVISTRFEGLLKFFAEDNGQVYVEREEAIAREVNKLKHGRIKVKNRVKILSLSWENIARKLSDIYSGLIEDIAQ